MSEFFFWLGLLLEAVLLWRLLGWRAWRAFPTFCFLIVFLIARLAVLQWLVLYIPVNSAAYSSWYWFTSLFAKVLELLVAWEIYRRMLPREGIAHRVASLLFGGTLLVLTALCLVAGIRSTNFFIEVGTDFEFSIAVLMVGALIITRYYGHPLNLNAWGITLGLGLFAAGSVMNFSALGIDERMYPIFRYIRPLLFDLTLVIWVVTLWSRASPMRSFPSLVPDTDSALEGRPGLWNRVGQTIEKALRMRQHR